jgi:excisionase family DNA binding protein
MTMHKKESAGSGLLRPLDAAALLNISRSKLYDEIARGRIPIVKVGGLKRIPRRWLEQQINDAIESVESEAER